jgi:hypothetical protein
MSKQLLRDSSSPCRTASFCLLVLLFLAAPNQGRASTIAWGTFFNDNLLDSTGVTLSTSFTFEIGTFDAGFDPSAHALSEWADAWNVFDAAINGEGWTPGDQFVDRVADHIATGESTSKFATPGAIFTEGSTAYLWVFNSKNTALSPEWALLADTTFVSNQKAPWTIPDPALLTDVFEWQTQDLDTAVFGGVNGVQGPGDRTSSPSSFTIQTHVVPEPSSAFLVLVPAMLSACRRRRLA